MTIEKILLIIFFVILAFLVMPKPPKKWNGETDPDKM